MASNKHEMTPADLNKAYEENDVNMKGILGFIGGLSLLIITAFILMMVLWKTLGNFRHEAEASEPGNPMRMSQKEALPAEPRLQSAPGFGVDSPEGRVNLELESPDAEWKALHKQWIDLWRNGEKDKATGSVVILPINEAKEKFLASNPKARTGDDADKLFQDSHLMISDASAGRLAGEIRR
ncbi:MAG: hypothetical protein HS105_11370 [Chloracidobacterium sp.]|nr:hypothetical protein [Chloracidobacterium sp.]MCC6824709.1 hypothetical protein [Acidobacteriota bacterium]